MGEWSWAIARRGTPSHSAVFFGPRESKCSAGAHGRSDDDRSWRARARSDHRRRRPRHRGRRGRRGSARAARWAPRAQPRAHTPPGSRLYGLRRDASGSCESPRPFSRERGRGPRRTSGAQLSSEVAPLPARDGEAPWTKGCSLRQSLLVAFFALRSDFVLLSGFALLSALVVLLSLEESDDDDLALAFEGPE